MRKANRIALGLLRRFFLVAPWLFLCSSPASIFSPSRASAVEPQPSPEPQPNPEQLLSRFSKAWDESAWENPHRYAPKGYMRPLNDSGWLLRMKILRSLVAQGAEATPAPVKALVKAMSEGDVPTRILAAQALGYLGEKAPLEPLLAATKDKNATVRLYAVDALAMRGAVEASGAGEGRAAEKIARLSKLFKQIAKGEKNRDVKMHLRYAQDRKGKSIDPKITQKLIDWDINQLDTARLGKLAPDFELLSLTGEKVALKDFRGKQAVVLIFIYGDT